LPRPNTRKSGFDPREFIKKHGVEADIGVYTEA
jgi:hypothetical protein